MWSAAFRGQTAAGRNRRTGLDRPVLATERPASAAEAPRTWLTVAALVVIVLLGAAFRLEHLDARTMGHMESYVPGIPLPPYISDPPPRIAFLDAIRGPMFHEPHPPGWYVAMWPWTKLFGTSLFAIRLPSAILGVAGIVLVYVLGALVRDRWTGLFAAGLLALNGFHVQYSQIARPATWTAVLALASTLLLLLVVRGGPRSRLHALTYFAVTLAGLGSLYYFWPVLATQMLWAALRMPGQTRPMWRLLRLQLLLVIVGSPLLGLALSQHTPLYLEGDTGDFLSEYLSFGFLFEPDIRQVAVVQEYVADWVRQGLPALASLLLLFGLLRRRARTSDEPPADVWSPSGRVISLATLLSVACILELARYLHAARPERTHLVVASSVAPIGIFLAIAVLDRRNEIVASLARLIGRLCRVRPGPLALVYMLAIVPIVLFASVSLVVPFYADRHMLIYVPFMLIGVGIGLVECFRATSSRIARSGALALLAALVAVHAASLSYNYALQPSPNDFHGLAEQWIPRLQDGDVVLVRPHWGTTAMFYYLDCARFRCVGFDYEQTVLASHAQRLWVLTVGPISPEGVEGLLARYEPSTVLEARKLRVQLYVLPR